MRRVRASERDAHPACRHEDVRQAVGQRWSRPRREGSGYVASAIGSIDEVVIDCAEPGALAAFWSGVLGGEPVERDEAWWYVLPPGWTQLSFQRVPEAKTVKNRVHLDVRVADIAAATARAVALGARAVGGVQSDTAGAFQVLVDPEDNEWCLVRPARPSRPPAVP